MSEDRDITAIITDEGCSADERAAALLPLVYDQLRAIAAARLIGERPGHTLQPTALVHEAYIKLLGDRRIPWAGRAHFYAAAADAMRQLLIDHARARGRQKRGGGRRRVHVRNLEDLVFSSDCVEVMVLDDAFRRLEVHAPEVASVVRMRFYAGLSVSETASALAISQTTVKRRWEVGRTWLFRELSTMESDDGEGADESNGPGRGDPLENC